MASVKDVAAYILNKLGEMTTMKLQKLVYYCQAWSLVWDEQPVFSDRIEAWANGPVVPNLYYAHKGLYSISSLTSGDASKINVTQQETIDSVLDYYGKQSSQWLSELTHKEGPWLEARKGLGPGDRGENEITHSSMMEYYSSL